MQHGNSYFDRIVLNFGKCEGNISVLEMCFLKAIFTFASLQLLDTQEMQPEMFIRFITQSLELAVSYNFTDQGAGKHRNNDQPR